MCGNGKENERASWGDMNKVKGPQARLIQTLLLSLLFLQMEFVKHPVRNGRQDYSNAGNKYDTAYQGIY